MKNVAMLDLGEKTQTEQSVYCSYNDSQEEDKTWSLTPWSTQGSA